MISAKERFHLVLVETETIYLVNILREHEFHRLGVTVPSELVLPKGKLAPLSLLLLIPKKAR